MAKHHGAPAQPPWLQGYPPRFNGSLPSLPADDFPSEIPVRGDSCQNSEVADTPVNSDNGQWDKTDAASESVASQSDSSTDPHDPVEARAAELLRLLGQNRPAVDAPVDEEPQQRVEVQQPATVHEHSAVPEWDVPRWETPAAAAYPQHSPHHTLRPLDEAAIANRGRFAPRSGWRRAVYRVSAGRVNPGDSPRDRRRDEVYARIRQPVRGDFRIAVLSIKGGVGKTTTTLGLGSAFARIRTDRVIAVDANPDRGTLAQRVDDPSRATVRDLLSDPNITRYSDVRAYTRMSESRLEVLGSPIDPAISEAFCEADYRRTIDILQSYYNIVLTDCGTGIMHSAMAGVLDLAHAVVLVSSPALDAARSASATLEWLTQHGYSGLAQESHLVLSAARPGASAVHMEKVYEHFQSRCRSVHLIPFDFHLAEGGEIDVDLLKPATFEAYVELAGAISEKFGLLRPNV